MTGKSRGYVREIIHNVLYVDASIVEGNATWSQDPFTALRLTHCMYGSRRSSAAALLRELRRASGIFACALRSCKQLRE